MTGAQWVSDRTYMEAKFRLCRNIGCPKVSLKLWYIFPSLTAHIKPSFCPVWSLVFPCIGPAALIDVMWVSETSKLTHLLWKPFGFFCSLFFSARLIGCPSLLSMFPMSVCEFSSPGEKFTLSSLHMKSDKEGSASSFFSGKAGFMTHRWHGR